MARETVTGTALSKPRIAYQWIRSRIADGTFSPGYRQTFALVEGYAAAPLLTSGAPARARALDTEPAGCLGPFEPARFTGLNRGFHAVLFEGCRH
ncbi:hypothetical protein AB0J55_18245 [Amycolatopsis sp. NPDC049688]|uniref:hypothetical protein n=1 Tax=Amycolatopsis sp. NPDC049688 TaxID=3154733 RepID=UPI0034400F2D